MRQHRTPDDGGTARIRALRRVAGTAAVVAWITLLAVPEPAAAQAAILSNMRHSSVPVNYGLPEYRGGFTFCRLRYENTRRVRKSGWNDDYPASDFNFMSRLEELTTTTISQWAGGDPGFVQVTIDDPDLFRCPFLKMQNGANKVFWPAEVLRLREYLLRGGFLWIDDNWTDTDLRLISAELGRVLPEHGLVELTPEHPLFSVVYRLERVPQIPSIESWRRSGQAAQYNEGPARLYAIFGEHDRLMVLVSHNSDVSDSWEREGDDPQFFYTFSPGGYGIGINIAMWVMTR